MTNFKQLREAARNLAVRATGDDGEEAKLNDLPSDQSKLDDADENNRNPDGTAEDQVEKSVKPIYTKTDNGTYTLATESKYRSHPRAAADDKEAARLDKIARAAAAREKDQAAQKEKAKEKHYAASKKSREAVKHFGNKDQFGRPKNEEVEDVEELTDLSDFIKKGGKRGGLRDKIDKKIGDRSHAKATAARRDADRSRSRGEIKKFVKAKKKFYKHVDRRNAADQRRAARNEEYDFNLALSENTIDDIKKLTTLSQAGTVRFADGSSAKVSPESATAILQTHGNLNTNNQAKFAKKLASSSKEFAKLEKFALQQSKLSGRLYQLNNL
jgi:hypothetical protein